MPFSSKELKTPAGAALKAPTQALNIALAEEMGASLGKFDPAKMPLTQLLMTAIDITGKNRAEIIARLVKYADTDLLCHRAENDEALAQEQAKIWQPILDWCAHHLHAPLRKEAGLMPIAQAPESIASLRHIVEAYDNFYLTGIDWAAGITGSLILTLALVEDHLTAEKTFEAAELDTLYQMKKWGIDPVTLKRQEIILQDLKICQRWFALLKNPT